MSREYGHCADDKNSVDKYGKAVSKDEKVNVLGEE